MELAVSGTVLNVLGPQPVASLPSLTLSGFAVRKADVVYVALSLYEPGSPQHTVNSSTVAVTYSVPCGGCTVGRSSEYSLNTTSSVYDQIYRDLAAQGMLKYDDDMVYSIGEMGTKAGVTWVRQHAEPYFAMQKAAFTPVAFAGSVVKTDAGLDVMVAMPLQGTILIELVLEPAA